jgi:protein TonB
VVGISFESTVKGGKGPTFAVGNTRMGETGERASGPTGLKPLPKGRTSGKVGSPNRVASAIPSAGVTLVKPKRLSALQPDYPSILKAQGVEGNVVVLVSIDEKGQVTRVKILKGSGYDAMDTSAKRAAAKERFSPARRNGEPIAYTLKYTYRFRVRES